MALALALALAIGLSLGLLGGGGSILAVPALVYAVGLQAKPAIATSLLVVGITSAAALLPHARAGHVRWRTGLVFGAAGMAGAFAGGQLARFFAGNVLLLLFAAMMVATALAMWRGPAARRPEAGATARPTAKIVVDGLVVGLVTGLVGAGGGFLVVPALVLFGGLPMPAAVGTSLLVIAMKSFAGFLGYVAHVSVDLELALSFSASAVVGSLVGGRLVARVPPARLRRGFAAFVLVMAAFMVYQERAALCVGCNGVASISAEQLRSLAASPRAPLILDARTPAEFAAGHVPGAVNIPHTEIAERLDEIEPAEGRGIVVYCERGGRARQAARELQAAGFPDVRELTGHMAAWRDAGLPLAP